MKITDDQLLRAWKQHGSASKIAKLFGVSERQLLARRVRLERKLGEPLIQTSRPGLSMRRPTFHGRKHFDLKDGVALIGSDGHYWPGIISTAHRAFVYIIKQLKPSMVAMNGDAFDGARISRFPSIGWQEVPEVAQELDAVDERLSEIRDAANHHNLFWQLGNHDMRFESTIANRIPEFRNAGHFSLKERYPDWQPCWSLWVNDDVVIKHRWKGGIHAAHNNTLWSGKTILTGHTHVLQVTELRDYNGCRWGVQTGTLAELGGPQFNDYTEDNPTNWNPGFIVCTFWKGRLLTPEKVRVLDEERGLVEFRGHVIEV
jgi:hypothetical protein